jgi:hypothetical protein
LASSSQSSCRPLVVILNIGDPLGDQSLLGQQLQ